jgi:hypothetical protein
MPVEEQFILVSFTDGMDPQRHLVTPFVLILCSLHNLLKGLSIVGNKTGKIIAL